MTADASTFLAATVTDLWDELTSQVAAGRRFADLFGTAQPGRPAAVRAAGCARLA